MAETLGPGAASGADLPLAHRYARFFVVGSTVALLTVAIREVLARLLGDDSRVAFSVSVVGAYGIGIIVNFALQSRFTFADRQAMRRGPVFARFAGVALVGAAVAWICALAFRYGLHLDDLLGRASSAVAFGAACIVASFATFALNLTLVFRAR